jgi:hypothetical protein
MPREPHAAAGDATADTALIRHEGDYWTLVYAGTVVRIRGAKGLDYLAQLLRAPGRVFHVTQLAAPVVRDRRAGSREPTAAAVERARKAVTNRIRDAVRRIGAAHERLGVHLRNAVHTGTSCSYTPERDIRWEE